MAIIFENIDTGETISIDKQTGGAHYRAKLSAAINSSNLHQNADRGQDHGWRVQPEQQAIIEEWEEDGEMVEKVSNFTKVPVDGLSHGEFLAYLLHQQELGTSPERAEVAKRRDNQSDYNKRVAELKAQKTAEPVAPFVAKAAAKK